MTDIRSRLLKILDQPGGSEDIEAAMNHMQELMFETPVLRGCQECGWYMGPAKIWSSGTKTFHETQARCDYMHIETRIEKQEPGKSPDTCPLKGKNRSK